MNVGVLASGAGTNLQAILDRLHGRHGIEVVAVGSDRPDAPALARARAAGVPAASFPLAGRDDPGGDRDQPAPGRDDARGDRDAARRAEPPASAATHADRATRDAAMADWLAERGTELVVLAGYMQLLDSSFLARFPNRVINVHPALLPAFPGLRAIEQALAYGVKVFGVTVHFVDEGVDTGPVIAQRALELPDATDPAAVREALRPLEHDLLCQAVADIAGGAVRLDPANPRRVVVGR
jgi:phosphoribosylglycinamide formyltransferase 1